MPVLSIGHANYWSGPPAAVGGAEAPLASYPLWEASHIACSAFGALHVVGTWVVRNWRYWIGELRWWIGAWGRLRRERHWHPLSRPFLEGLQQRLSQLSGDQQFLLLRTLAALERPEYATAKAIVKETALTLGFNRPEAWIDYSRTLKASTRQAENTFRHLKVVFALKSQFPHLTNPEAHLLAELGYQGYAQGTHFGVRQ